jgi:N-terminal domain of reverse transcriptase
MVNGPEDATLSWEAVDWRHHEDHVRRLRQRIFTAAQEGNSTTHLSRPRGLLELLAVKAARAVLSILYRVLPNSPHPSSGGE